MQQRPGTRHCAPRARGGGGGAGRGHPAGAVRGPRHLAAAASRPAVPAAAGQAEQRWHRGAEGRGALREAAPLTASLPPEDEEGPEGRRRPGPRSALRRLRCRACAAAAGRAGRGGGRGFRRHAAPRGGAMATAAPGMESAGGRGTAGAG